MKKTVKKTGAKKVSVKRVPTRKAAARKSTGPSRSASPVPTGHRMTPSGFWVPERAALKLPKKVVPASKLERGIATAKEKISGVLQELVEATRDNYEITEIELSASFNSEGKFLGFGVGGEMCITFRVRPVEA